ncbi:TetR/AcrR family transcriptional regulator [Pseudonocardia lacus]|uniref:TetR/AcrR family transcriptional regulator n=1 Tax=Pseudonocardia lacus TaxID=2835865 RepID=UPI001BDC39F6|nr:TetR/AcrR family transcriptional regulator [Pseudonocardia lacus]
MATAGVRRAQREETAAALKRAAVRVFDRVGYLNAKITDITAEAGRAAGSFYSHFPNKEALLEALLADVLASSDELAVDPAHSGDFTDRDAVRHHVAGYWAYFRRNRAVMVALQQAATVDERFSRRMSDMLEPDLHHLAEHLQQARAGGAVLPGDPLVVTTAMTALMSGFAHFWLVQGWAGHEIDDDEAVDTLTSFIYSGIGGTPTPPPQRPRRTT